MAQMKRGTPEIQTPISKDMFLPNHSGIASHPESNKNYLRTDGGNSPTASIDWNGQSITNGLNFYFDTAYAVTSNLTLDAHNDTGGSLNILCGIAGGSVNIDASGGVLLNDADLIAYDNNIIAVGDGQDFKIYSDGSQGYAEGVIRFPRDATANINVLEFQGGDENLVGQKHPGKIKFLDTSGNDFVEIYERDGTGLPLPNIFYIEDTSNDVQILTYTDSSTQKLITINDTGADVDLRIQSDTFTNMVYLDSANAKIGFAAGTTPEGRVEIAGGTTWGTHLLTLDQNDVDEAFIEWQGSSASDESKNVSTATNGTLSGFVKVTVSGSDYWMPYYSSLVSTAEHRVQFAAGYVTPVSGASQWLYGNGSTLMSATVGHVAIRDGSVVGVSCTSTITGYSAAGTLRVEVYVNGASVFTTDQAISAAGTYSWLATQARDTDTFTAGQQIAVLMTKVSGTFSYGSILAIVECVYDS